MTERIEVARKTQAKKGTLALLSALTLFIFSAGATAGEVVIGHPDIKTNTLTQQQVSDLFLRKLFELPDGTKVTVFDHKDDEVIKEEFYRKVMNMTIGQLKAYWAKAQFTEKRFPPLPYRGDQAVKHMVANTIGGIGYIEEGAVDQSVKVLFKP